MRAPRHRQGRPLPDPPHHQRLDRRSRRAGHPDLRRHGLSHKDTVPEAIGPLLDRQIPGFGELFRQLSYEEIGSSALQSRALAGYANQTLLFCLPGSNNACETAWTRIIREQLDSGHRPAISPRTSRIAKTTDPMLDFDHAQTLLANAAGPLDRVEDVALADLAGRVLARDLTATVDIPRRQQRDGWLRAARGRLERRRAPAGAAALLRRRHARAAQAGARHPPVHRQPDSRRRRRGGHAGRRREADGHVRISRPPALGQHIRLRGEDTLAGARCWPPARCWKPPTWRCWPRRAWPRRRRAPACAWAS